MWHFPENWFCQLFLIVHLILTYFVDIFICSGFSTFLTYFVGIFIYSVFSTLSTYFTGLILCLFWPSRTYYVDLFSVLVRPLLRTTKSHVLHPLKSIVRSFVKWGKKRARAILQNPLPFCMRVYFTSNFQLAFMYIF